MKEKAAKLCVLLFILCFLRVPIAQAATIGVSGSGTIISPTAGGALPNFFQDKTAIVRGWDEQQNILLSKDVYVDIASSGIYNSISDLGKFNANKIAAGTAVSSHLIFFDPRLSKSVIDVSFTFSAPILGVIVESDRFFNKKNGFTDYFVNSDFLKNPLTPAANYPTAHFNNRGLEMGSPHDEIVVAISGPSITIKRFTASNPGDQVRVITMADTSIPPSVADVPEPSTMALGLLSLGVTGVVARLRGRKGRSAQV